ncbi:MAG: DUF4974 domain-containing protein [Bacteroidetes bacterium]|nr:MAG: DUF4974 domain-containing protein [Bacteroidota bacterium]
MFDEQAGLTGGRKAPWPTAVLRFAGGRTRKDGRPQVADPARAGRPRTPGLPRPVFWGGAVVVVALLVVLWQWYRPTLVTVPYGAVETIVLPDGSYVTLGSGSQLRYRPFAGRSVRRVVLTGEAFFMVVPADKPFVVETFNARVTSGAARFNVRAWPEDLAPETAVAVERGRVDVAARRAEGAVTLAAGQVTRVPKGQAPGAPGVPREERPLIWREGGLSFADQPLADVLHSLERRYAAELKVAPEVAERPVTYVNPFPASLEDVLSDLCFALGLHYRRLPAGGFEITPP